MFKYLFVVSIAVCFVEFLYIIDHESRSEYLFDNKRQYCGEVVDFYHDSDRGGISRGSASLRLVVSTSEGLIKFKVDDGYVRNELFRLGGFVGNNMCVEIVPTILGFDKKFISQIYIGGRSILDASSVRSAYFSKREVHRYALFIFSLVVLLIVIYKNIRKEI